MLCWNVVSVGQGGRGYQYARGKGREANGAASRCFERDRELLGALIDTG